MNINELKKLAAEKAVEEISSGMIIGLGSGSTVQFALEKISEKIKNGELKNIVGIPSSSNTEKEAIRLGIPLMTLNEVVKRETGNGKRKSEIRNQKPVLSTSEGSASSIQHPVSSIIDLTIDGADEVTVGHPNPDLSGEGSKQIDLIKGGGGALLREKILAQTSKRLIIITDETKLSKHLGAKWPVPVEVFKFAVGVEQKFLESLNAKVELRKNSDGSNYITDENNFILDADFGEIKNAKDLSNILNDRAGIAGHGLFIGLADKVICAMNDGEIRIQK